MKIVHFKKTMNAKALKTLIHQMITPIIKEKPHSKTYPYKIKTWAQKNKY